MYLLHGYLFMVINHVRVVNFIVSLFTIVMIAKLMSVVSVNLNKRIWSR